MVDFTKNGAASISTSSSTVVGISEPALDLRSYELYLQANRKSNGVGPRFTLRQRRELRDAIPANDLLRHLWSIGDKGIPTFGFGRVWDLFPILENADGITNYLIKGFLAGLPLQLKLGRNQVPLVSYSSAVPVLFRPAGVRLPIGFPFGSRLCCWFLGCRTKLELKNELGRRWAFAVLQLCHWLDDHWHDGWPFMGPAALAPQIFTAITTDDRIEHYFDDLRDRVARTMEAFIPPPGLPPPPPSIPSLGMPLDYIPLECGEW